MPATLARPDEETATFAAVPAANEAALIRTPDQRVRVFASSTLEELATERRAVRAAITRLRLVPVIFELGARPHPPREVYRSYLAQSQIFIGVYWQSYGWVAPGEKVSGLEDEYTLGAGLPRLIYVKTPAPQRDPRLTDMLARIEQDGAVCYQRFSDAADLQAMVENDLAVLLSERFEMTRPRDSAAAGAAAGAALIGAVPAPATSLVDREQETAAVEDLVVNRAARMVTLTGPGGVGKSRLAVQTAGRLGPKFRDGIRYVDLAPVSDAGLVPAAIAAGLGLRTSGGRLMTDLESYLRPRRLLLIMDNFEQVTAAAPLLAALQAAAPGLVALVTSRTVLRLSGEHELPVPPFPVPPPKAGEDIGDLLRYPSVRLFVDRARAAAPRFELTSHNGPAVAEICRRLDGLPLAIELAAARIRLLPPLALLARLDDRLEVLTGGPRDLPERQRTLKNTLDWSFGLLSAGERELFARLGVFAGTFGLPAAEAICGNAGPASAHRAGHVIDTLGSLVDSSLVQTETRGDEPRFWLLETVREYALDRLRDNGDWKELHDRHAAYFLTLAKPAESELHGTGQLAWLDRLETRHDNVVAALTWLVDQNRLESAVQLIWATWRFWWLHGHTEELAPALEKILARRQRISPHERAQALAGTGFTLITGGDYGRAQQLFEQSLPLYRRVNDELGAALAAAALGHLLALRHEYARSSDLLEQTLSQLQEIDSRTLAGPDRVLYWLNLALVDNFLGQIQLARGDHAAASHLFTDGLTVARRAPDRFTILVSLYDLALSSQAQDDLTGAGHLLQQGLSLAAEAGDEPSVAYYLEALATLARRQGNPERAVRLLAAATALLQAKGSGWLHAYVPRAAHDDEALAALRSGIGDAAFDRAWAQGRSEHSMRALRYALASPEPGLTS